LKFYGRLCGLSGRKLKERITDLLDQVSLGHARKQKVGTYSKGMLQRIGLAQALIHEPRLLILDEPTAGVDPVGDRVGIIFNGVLKREGTLEELITLKERLELVAKGSLEAQEKLIESAKSIDGLDLVSSGAPKTSLESLFIQMSQEEND